MRNNDIKINDNIENLGKFRKANRNFKISVVRENQAAKGKIKKCDILENMKIKCEEMSKIYQSILFSFDDQSEALNRIFEILEK